MTILPVGDYRPDIPAYLGGHSTIAANVYFKPDGTVGPIKAQDVLTSTISFQPVSGFTARAGNGAVYIYVSAAYRPAIYRKYGTVFANYFTGGAGNATPLFPWRFSQFGDYVLAVNPVNGMVSQQVGSTSDFAAVSGAPAGAFIETIEPGFVMVGHIEGGSVTYPNRLHWSGINDHTSWPTVGTSAAASAQSDLQDLPNGGAITGILGAVGGAAGAVFTERAVYRMEYVGAPVVFAFREVERGAGNVCVNAAVAVDGVAYFIAEDGFRRFDGQNSRPIGDGRVSATFWSEVDREQLHRVNVAHDPQRKIIVWAYPTTSATSGNPNKWLIYSYATDKWTAADDAGVTVSLLFTSVRDAYPLDLLDGYLPSNPDQRTESWDGATVNGGAPWLAGMDSSYRFATFTGANLAARIETGEADAQGQRVYVSGIRPLTDAGTLTAQVGHRVSFADSVTYTTAYARGADYTAPARIATRYARARVNIPAGATWTYLQGADVTLRPEGRR